jgi:hypothetical protein
LNSSEKLQVHTPPPVFGTVEYPPHAVPGAVVVVVVVGATVVVVVG